MQVTHLRHMHRRGWAAADGLRTCDEAPQGAAAEAFPSSTFLRHFPHQLSPVQIGSSKFLFHWSRFLWVPIMSKGEGKDLAFVLTIKILLIHDIWHLLGIYLTLAPLRVVPKRHPQPSSLQIPIPRILSSLLGGEMECAHPWQTTGWTPSIQEEI